MKRGKDIDVTASIPAYRRIMPYLMQRRNESAVYAEFVLDLSRALPFLEQFNRGRTAPATCFHLFLRATTLAIARRPRINRYVMGRRFYQRDGIHLSFTIKKEFTDDSPLVVLKMLFPPEETLDQMVTRIHERLLAGRSKTRSYTDKELSLVLSFPRPILNFFIRLVRWADYFNLLPETFRRNDPMYASVFVANLGSLGLDAAWHHLYEYGDIPFFVTLGRIQEMSKLENGQLKVFPGMHARVTYDERIDDGVYVGKALDFAKEYIENPETLVNPLILKDTADVT
jgi:hypothetical protein